MATNLYLIRGIPGSGKSTLAKKLMYSFEDVCHHFEADMYFERSGSYEFDVTKLGAAHLWCQEQTRLSLEAEIPTIVSNTFTTNKELKPYFEIAKSLFIVPIVIHAQNQFQNVHSVPADKLEQMRNRFSYDLTPLFNFLKE